MYLTAIFNYYYTQNIFVLVKIMFSRVVQPMVFYMESTRAMFRLFAISLLLLFSPPMLGSARSEPCNEWVEGNTILEIKPYWETVGSEKIISCFNNGQSLKVRDKMGRTPLHLAAQYNQDPRVIKLLIQAGADLDARNAAGGTPLHDAAMRNPNPFVLETLIRAGADINAKNKNDWSPLHSTKFNRNDAVVRLLLESGAKVDAIDDMNRTPLHLAAPFGSIGKIVLLFTTICTHIN